jgi:hypothetical protein
MPELVLKRRSYRSFTDGRTKVHIGEAQYNKLAEVADETGKSLKSTLDIMVDYAYENIRYEGDEE